MNGSYLYYKLYATLKNNVVNAVLVIFILYGIAVSFLSSINYPLNSDHTLWGMMSIEMWKHHNFSLSGYYLYALDNVIFDSFLPFQLLPQILTNFNPHMIFIMGYVQFLVLILVFSYIIFRYSGNMTNALIFAALLANVDRLAYPYFSQSALHVGAMICAGVFILFFSDKTMGKLKLPIDNKHALILALLTILLFNLFVFSDSFFVLFFIVPLCVSYVFLYREKNSASNLYMAAVFLTTCTTYFFGKALINSLNIVHLLSVPFGIKSIHEMISFNLPLYLSGLLLLLNGNTYLILYRPLRFDTLSIILLLTIVALVLSIAYYVLQYFKNGKFVVKPLHVFLMMPAILIFIAYFITTLPVNISTTRYLTYTVLAFLVLAALFYTSTKKLYLGLILLVLLVSAVDNYSDVSHYSYNVNANQYNLIKFLESNNLTYGYGGYWESNIITYLSNERVTIRAVNFFPDHMEPYRHLSNERWYATPQGDFFIIEDGNQGLADYVQKYSATTPLVHTYKYETYTIYVFNQSQSL